MCHEIRKYMGDVDGSGPLGGPGKHVEIDETFIGGFRSPKTVVMGMLERGGDVMTQVTLISAGQRSIRSLTPM